MFRKLGPAIATLFVLLAMSGAAQAKSSILYSITATNVHVAKQQTGGYRVSLPANARLAWFTDRPARRAGTATAADLVMGWHANGFDAVPPNAAFVMTRGGASSQIIVVLKNARRQGTDVVFTARQLPHGKMLGMQTDGSLKPGLYPRAEFFIDDATIPPCGLQMSSGSVDCILSAGDGSVTLLTGIQSTMMLTVANVAPGAAPTTVLYEHSWRYGVLGSAGDHTLGTASYPESMTTPFTRSFGAVTRAIHETLQVSAPTDPSVALHVTITQHSLF
ncbi:MAG: hypothetical protein ACR2J9_01105 [Gaiellales bacterium]